MTLEMGIIKVEIKIPELVKSIEKFRSNSREAFEVIASDVKNSVTDIFNQLLAAEMDLFLGEADQSKNKRNGFIEREFSVKGIGCMRIRVPQDRNRKFKSVIVPKNEQIDSRLKEDLAVLNVTNSTMY